MVKNFEKMSYNQFKTWKKEIKSLIRSIKDLYDDICDEDDMEDWHNYGCYLAAVQSNLNAAIECASEVFRDQIQDERLEALAKLVGEDKVMEFVATNDELDDSYPADPACYNPND